jgi:hypothetical protein
MADLYGVAIGGGVTGNVDANARKLLGDGTSGVGPYTRFGTPQLQAIKVISSAYDFTTTPTVANSNMSKAVRGLQQLGEIYYAGVPTASGANQFIALINLNNTFNGATQGSGSDGTSQDGTYTAVEADILAELGGSGSVTITNSTLTGLTFN